MPFYVQKRKDMNELKITTVLCIEKASLEAKYICSVAQ
jgi:hypothetical protein